MNKDFDVIMEVSEVPKDFCPSSTQELLDGLVKFTRFRLPGGDRQTLVNVGHVEPSNEGRGLPWVRTSIDGAPLGLYVFYNGRWVKVHDKRIGEYVAWSGARVDLDKEPGFTFCDGNNGTPNLVDKMIPDSATADTYDYAIYMFTGYES